jgi:SAM-dependent methyltransferase
VLTIQLPSWWRRRMALTYSPLNRSWGGAPNGCGFPNSPVRNWIEPKRPRCRLTRKMHLRKETTLSALTVDEEDRWLRIGAAEKAVSIVQLTTGLTIHDVLEVGCGTGAVLEELDRRGFADQYWACEPSEPLCARLADRPISRLVETAATTLEDSPFAERRFDLVILSHVLEHVRDPALLLAVALRQARYAVVEVPIEGNVAGDTRAWFKCLWTRQPRTANPAGHIQFFSARDITKLVTWAGGQVLGSRRYFPRTAYHCSAAVGYHPYRRLILGLHAIAGDAITARVHYGHLAVLIHSSPLSVYDGLGHDLFWRPSG